MNADECGRCGGTGCDHCTGFPVHATFEKRDCPKCGGSGCDTCDGHGEVRVPE